MSDKSPVFNLNKYPDFSIAPEKISYLLDEFTKPIFSTSFEGKTVGEAEAYLNRLYKLFKEGVIEVQHQSNYRYILVDAYTTLTLALGKLEEPYYAYSGRTAREIKLRIAKDARDFLYSVLRKLITDSSTSARLSDIQLNHFVLLKEGLSSEDKLALLRFCLTDSELLQKCSNEQVYYYFGGIGNRQEKKLIWTGEMVELAIMVDFLVQDKNKWELSSRIFKLRKPNGWASDFTSATIRNTYHRAQKRDTFQQKEERIHNILSILF